MASEQPGAEEIERAIRQLGTRPAHEAIPALTLVANRAVIELNRVAREQASLHRGQAEWGKWARLANSVRSGILQLAAIRDSVKGLGLSSGPTATEAAAPEAAAPEAVTPAADSAASPPDHIESNPS
jgi:hypothetical protein